MAPFIMASLGAVNLMQISAIISSLENCGGNGVATSQRIINHIKSQTVR